MMKLPGMQLYVRTLSVFSFLNNLYETRDKRSKGCFQMDFFMIIALGIQVLVSVMYLQPMF